MPDLVIYLQATSDVLLRRIYDRGIDYELRIDESYLQRIVDAYVDFFYHYDAAPLLIVNTAGIDLADGDRDYEMLLEYIRDLPPGRHYLNPGEL